MRVNTMRNKTLNKTLAIIFGVFIAVCLAAGCSEKIVNTQEKGVEVSMCAKLSTPAMAQYIDHFQVMVTARDFILPIIEPLELVDGYLRGEVIVPAGRERIFVVQALDKEDNVLYSGVTVADVLPGKTVELSIDLYPIAPMLYITPHYQEVYMGDSFAVDIMINMVPELSSIHFGLSNSSAPIYIDSSILGFDLDTANTGYEAWHGDFLYHITLAWGGQSPNSITDAAGNAHLATIFFDSHAEWGGDSVTSVLDLQILFMWDTAGDSMSIDAAYTNNATVELFRPL